ncbi:MAG: hypothetical protein ACLQI7_29135 [Streptosporangiaceae bacterium]
MRIYRPVNALGILPGIYYIHAGGIRDENIAFAARLMQAWVPTELLVNPGAYHAAESFAPESALSQRIWERRIDALRRALA